MRTVSNAASALGEAIGKLIETSLIEGVKEEVLSRGYTIESARLKNGSDNIYQIDAVVFDQENNPIILLESKYIRYKKHNRDKASWLCVAHYNLRKTYPTIRKSIAVLAGNWSRPSKSLLHSFGVEVIELPFEHTVRTLASFGIIFEWDEKDRETPLRSWEAYCSLDENRKKWLAINLTESIQDKIKISLTDTLDTNLDDIQQSISEVEVLLRTNRGEMILQSYKSVADSLQGLIRLVEDKPNPGDELS